MQLDLKIYQLRAFKLCIIMVTHNTLYPIDQTQQHLIEYYQAFELLLSKQRNRNELRTHFGLLHDRDIPADYCFFKSIIAPDQYPDFTAITSKSSDLLHEILFSKQLKLPKSVLDVGFGSGGTIKKLAESWKNTQLDGINLNPTQFQIAKQNLSSFTNINLLFGNYLNFRFNKTYDLIYFIESAFHMQDKNRLLEQTANQLSQGGEAYIVDIFYAERVKNLFAGKRKVNEAIFDYMSVDDWEQMGAKHGLKMTSFEDYSNEAGNHICVQTSETDFKEELVQPLLKTGLDEPEIMEQRIWEAYYGYRKLHKLFKKGLLHYGIIRFTK